MATPFEQWEAARRNRVYAEEWDNLPTGPRYQGDAFSISKAHSTIKLTRAGQQSCGGKNYWESPATLNDAILTVLIRRQKELIAEAIAELRERERVALVACEAFAEEMRQKIDSAKEAVEA